MIAVRFLWWILLLLGVIILHNFVFLSSVSYVQFWLFVPHLFAPQCQLFPPYAEFWEIKMLYFM